MMKMKGSCGLIVWGAVLLIGGVFYAKPLAAAQTDNKAAVENKSVQQELVSRPKVEYKAQNLRDPFQPLLTQEKNSQADVQQVKTLPTVNIQGVIWGGIFPQAIIDEKVVKKGDMVGEMRIVEIGKEGITVLFDNKEYVLSPSVGMGQKPTAAASQQPAIENKQPAIESKQPVTGNQQPAAQGQQPAVNSKGGSREN